MSNYFGAQPSSPFYAQQQQLPLHTNHGAPPPQHQQQQPSYPAVSPVSAQSYSPSPPQQAPLRPHTTAPYAGSGFAPPQSAGPAGYYQQFPPQQPQQQQQSQQGYRPQQQQPQQAASDYGGSQQTQQPRNNYAPTPAAPAHPAPSTGYPSDIPHLASSHGVPPEVVQKLAADLMRSIQQSNIPPPTVAPVGPPPRLDHPVLPGGAPAPGMAQPAPLHPAPLHPPMMQQQQPSQIHIPGSFPSYPPAPAPQEPPQVPHHQYRQQQQQQQQQPQGYPSQPQGYFPPQPIPASNPPAPSAPTTADSKGPPPPGPVHPPMQQRQNDAPRRDTSQRYRSNTTSTHHSHTSTPATSTSSGPAGKDGSILYELWGDLVDQEPGREPKPKEKLVRLLREIANYIIKERAPTESIVITPEKMVDFYAFNAVEGDDRMDWKGYFNNRTESSLSSIYRVLNCEHFYVPTGRDQKPTIPALTPQGFETWMFTQLMTHPSREAARIQKIVALWPIHDTKEGRRFPKSIPRRCFPDKEDSLIFQGWWRVWEEFPPDYEEEEEEQAPLTLPAPGDSSGNRYYGPPPLHGPLPGPAYATTPMARKGAQQKYPPNPRDLNDDELDAIIEGGKDKSPPIERHRKPYASSTGNPGWKEELNPRPTLGEDKASSTRNGPPPPSRPHTSHGHHPSRDAREFREEPYAKPGPERDPRDPRDPGDPRDPRNPRDPRDPREPREPREPRDPRDLSDSPETPLGRSKSTRRGHQRERSQYRHSHRHSHSHHRGGGRRDRSADEHDPEWSGSSGVSAQTPISVPDAGVPIPGATPAPPPLEAQDRMSSRAQRRKADEAARVARQQEELFRGFVPSGRHEPPADPYEYDDFAGPPPGRGRERDDRRVAEYAYQDEYDRDRRAQQPGGGPGNRRSSHHVGDRGRARDRSSYWP